MQMGWLAAIRTTSSPMSCKSITVLLRLVKKIYRRLEASGRAVLSARLSQNGCVRFYWKFWPARS